MKVCTSYYGGMRGIGPGWSLRMVSTYYPDRARQYGMPEHKLAPDKNWLWLPRDQFNKLFERRLSLLDASAVTRKWPDKVVLLCYEKPFWRCHRRLVAEWLETKLGIVVTEYGYPREMVPAYADMSDKKDLPTQKLFW